MANSDSKLCECGCGRPAPISPDTDQKRGYIRGQPRRFIQGHHTKTHGYSKIAPHVNLPTPTYASWSSMLSRCINPNDIAWDNYGGRGVTVCDEWRKFENFLADMGERPPRTSLDRFPDQNGNYQPDNCRWATSKEQNRNRRSNHLLTFCGSAKTIAEWAEQFGLGDSTISERLKRGWTVREALTTPTKTAKLYEYRGERHTLVEWAKILGVRKARLDDRLIAGWSVERAFSEPRGPTGPKPGQSRRRHLSHRAST